MKPTPKRAFRGRTVVSSETLFGHSVIRAGLYGYRLPEFAKFGQDAGCGMANPASYSFLFGLAGNLAGNSS